MSTTMEELGNSNSYLTIIGGKLSQKVTEDTPGATKREYETSDGGTGVKWEKYYKNLSGRITAINFQDSPFGENLQITMEDIVLSLNTDSKYFTSFARKLPNIDLEKDVTLNSFDFEDKGKRFTGLSISQDGNKVDDYYYDTTKKKNKNGFPEVNQEELDEEGKDYWKGYFLNVKKFLKKEVKKVTVPAYIANDASKEVSEEISVEDIPF